MWAIEVFLAARVTLYKYRCVRLKIEALRVLIFCPFEQNKTLFAETPVVFSFICLTANRWTPATLLPHHTITLGAANRISGERHVTKKDNGRNGQQPWPRTEPTIRFKTHRHHRHRCCTAWDPISCADPPAMRMTQKTSYGRRSCFFTSSRWQTLEAEDVNITAESFAILGQHRREHRDSFTSAGAFFRRWQGRTKSVWCSGVCLQRSPPAGENKLLWSPTLCPRSRCGTPTQVACIRPFRRETGRNASGRMQSRHTPTWRKRLFAGWRKTAAQRPAGSG